MPAAEPTTDISVVICAYTEQRWYALLAAVESLQQQTLPPREIIVVIDHNHGLYEHARQSLAGVTLLENDRAQGLSGARNCGIAASSGAIVAFLDDDAAAAPDWLAQLASCYADAAVIGAGGAIAPDWQAARPRWFPDEFGWVIGCTYTGMPAQPAPVRNLIGANMSFRREVFEQLGGFRNGVGQVGASMLRCDDTEFCIRVGQRWPGGVFLFAPAARVFHQVTRERTRWGYFRLRCYTEGQAKAVIAQLLGSRDGLSSERVYTLQTLPAGVARGLADALRGDLSGLGRAGAIVAGLALTASGYLVGRLTARPNAATAAELLLEREPAL